MPGYREASERCTLHQPKASSGHGTAQWTSNEIEGVGSEQPVVGTDQDWGWLVDSLGGCGTLAVRDRPGTLRLLESWTETCPGGVVLVCVWCAG